MMLRLVLGVLVSLVALTGCATASEDPTYRIAGGGTPGVYYQYGEKLAEALQHDFGTSVTVDETQGSVDNLLRVSSGEALAGFAQADTAADAVAGEGSFFERVPVVAVARVYDEYVHLVVPADSEVHEVSDLAGHRVSLGSMSSGVQVIASRVLAAEGVELDDVDDRGLGLGDSIEAMKRGELEAFFWVGGLPTPGIEQLTDEMPLRLVPIDADTVTRVNESHAGVYRLAEFPSGVYGGESPVMTMTVPNYLITSPDAPESVVSELTRVLFEQQSQIAREVRAAEFLDRRQAIFTAPVELHPGAAEYYRASRW